MFPAGSVRLVFLLANFFTFTSPTTEKNKKQILQKVWNKLLQKYVNANASSHANSICVCVLWKSHNNGQ